MSIQDFTIRAILFSIIFHVFKSPIVLLLTGIVAGILWYDSHPNEMKESVCITSTWITEKTGISLYSNPKCEALGLKQRLRSLEDKNKTHDVAPTSSSPLSSDEFTNLGDGVPW